MDYEGNPWDKQPGETNKSYDCFLHYKDLPPSERSILKAYKKYKKGTKKVENLNRPPNYVLVWSGSFNWVDRVGHWDAHNYEIRRRRLMEERREEQNARLQMLRALKVKVATYMNAYDPKDPDSHLTGRELMQLVKGLFDEQRTELGVDEDVTVQDMADIVTIILPDNGRG